MVATPKCLQPTMVELQEIFKNHHVFYVHYKQTSKILRECERAHDVVVPNLTTHWFFEAQTNRRQYNLLFGNEIIVFFF